MIGRAALEAGFGGMLVVDLPDLLGAVDRRVERDVGITLRCRPDDRLRADHAGDPDAWIRLLPPHPPGIDDPVLIMRALPPERARGRPRLYDHSRWFLETPAGARPIDASRELPLTPPAHKPPH